MPERKVTIAVGNLGPAAGAEVPVLESTERWTELTLEDGSVIRIKPVVLAVVRLDDRYDAEGNPLYAVKAGQVMAIVNVPEHLRQRGRQQRDAEVH